LLEGLPGLPAIMQFEEIEFEEIITRRGQFEKNRCRPGPSTTDEV